MMSTTRINEKKKSLTVKCGFSLSTPVQVVQLGHFGVQALLQILQFHLCVRAWMVTAGNWAEGGVLSLPAKGRRGARAVARPAILREGRFCH